ncbi:MAG: hypothetical protein UX31_C0016G0019 [Candidatus Nomurabacteria bacterium GW2011_GWA1_46_11]|uniref:Uncharacterized protein n=1 Tax=Candidatus Nomurabacteria bacterium GW2011_GWA1_46_11 TaxID=1618732 RepID=A0A0G1NMF2_9BACT|nr:MAG: hypothetical protein UW69_C0012G0019 [Microgenomates group bacterium GW2011_GWA2_44_7]KKT77373.1 MAG: hypothetical protein UW73_C0021G0006 [Microgenomates group bacterium GW2011_GWB1_44_8]KKU21542.1 MAG: hypothetical protein UX31_C0016G0019 [Candidatus Nomurabacteria bacterium GW2011_GWA1_46_11]
MAGNRERRPEDDDSKIEPKPNTYHVEIGDVYFTRSQSKASLGGVAREVVIGGILGQSVLQTDYLSHINGFVVIRGSGALQAADIDWQRGRQERLSPDAWARGLERGVMKDSAKWASATHSYFLTMVSNLIAKGGGDVIDQPLTGFGYDVLPRL